MKKIYSAKTFSYFLAVLFGVSVSIAQPSQKLKTFLWEKDFETLRKNFAEDQIILKDIGDIKQRLELRSFTEAPGMRVQIFAGTDRENAENIAEQARAWQLDSVYVEESKDLFKVQLGNFRERIEAEKLLDRLRFKGMENAWIVHTAIHVPKSSVKRQTSEPEAADVAASLVYTIQLFVTKDAVKARQFQQEASKEIPQPVWIRPEGNLWKVLAGKFDDESSARQSLSAIRSAHFPDAWLTQVAK
ncbi:hypothetical protein B1H10_05985 [candidate division KSB1 bacterium 4484_188]|nr:MAG: hypothetical protein B1H10_05985 [candidate division KSB1 bacterium 4484_188]